MIGCKLMVIVHSNDQLIEFLQYLFSLFFFSRHYKQAYGHILELRMYDTNLLEIKTIAGFINYKVSALHKYIRGSFAEQIHS